MKTLTKKRAPKRAAKQTKLPTWLKPIGIITKVGAQPKCVAAQCFTNKKVFAYPLDLHFDLNDNHKLLPKTLPASEEVKAVGYKLTRATTEAELAKVGGTFTNFLQIEDLILRTEKGENIDFVTNGRANIFLLKVGASVFTLRAYRFTYGWDVFFDRFSPRRKRRTGRRFFSCVPPGHLP